MSMREAWACPDIGGHKDEGRHLPIPGSTYAFDECPAFFLREAQSGLPAPHLIDGVTHPASLVGEWAFEVESGSRSIDSLTPKARELVHLYLSEKGARMAYEAKLRRESH